MVQDNTDMLNIKNLLRPFYNVGPKGYFHFLHNVNPPGKEEILCFDFQGYCSKGNLVFRYLLHELCVYIPYICVHLCVHLYLTSVTHVPALE